MCVYVRVYGIYGEHVPGYNDGDVRYPPLDEMAYIAKHSERVSRFCFGYQRKTTRYKEAWMAASCDAVTAMAVHDRSCS